MARSRALLVFVGLLIIGGILGAGGSYVWAKGSAASSAVTNRVASRTFAPATATGLQPVSSRSPVPAAAAGLTISIQPGANTESQILEAVYKKVNPSVVKIVNLAQPQSRRFRSLGAIPQGEGSGFVWDTQGHIVTNDHVVEGADQLQVTFADGTIADAQLVGTDPGSDLAVIKVDPAATTLAPVELGDMSQVQVGEMAIAIGNPFGYEGTMTRGIVSALGRSIASQTSFSIPEAIQTDASINPGNSGGPLLNEQGQVIGVNDQIESASGSNSGVGFAIPVSILQRVAPVLIKMGSYQHAYLGFSGETYSKVWAKTLGLPANAKGVYVLDVVSGGPAESSGLRAGSTDTSVLLSLDRTGPVYLQSGGDLITAIDGRSISKIEDLLVYLEETTSPGQTVKLTVLRHGKPLTLTVTLDARSGPAGA
jgi:S1-C subfamily serine protease